MKKVVLRFLAKLDRIRSLAIVRLEKLFGKNELCRCKKVLIGPLGYPGIILYPYTARIFYLFRGKRSFGFRLSGVMDPINLVFFGGNSDTIRKILEKAGWRVGSGGVQYTCIDGKILFPIFDMEFVPEHDPHERFHMRLYETTVLGASWVIAAAHHEFYDRHEENHIVYSWEEAEKAVSSAFMGYPQTKSHIINEINYHGKPSDGRATIIDLRGS